MTDFEAIILLNQLFSEYARAVMAINDRLCDTELSLITVDATFKLNAITDGLVKSIKGTHGTPLTTN